MSSGVSNSAEQRLAKLKIHFLYVGLILSGIIVLLAAFEWTGLGGFTEYLSVAATITSLVLGVLAIIYSFVSSNLTNHALSSIDFSANEIRNIGGELREIVSGGQELQGKAERRNEELHSLIGDLRNAFEIVSSKTAEIAGAVETLPTRFGELRDEVRKRGQAEQNQPSQEDVRSMWTYEKKRAFLSNTSVYGIVAIKALVYAASEKKFSNLKHIFNTDNRANFEYAYGFLICASSAGVMKFDYPNGKTMAEGNARIKDLSDEFSSLVEKEWLKRLNSDNPARKRLIAEHEARIKTSIVDIQSSDV